MLLPVVYKAWGIQSPLSHSSRLHALRKDCTCAENQQIAVFSTTPWDSYLIHTRIWTYPPTAIIGPTLFGIPAEEVFFFIIQTYNTSLLYLLLSKPIFHPIYLRGRKLLHDSRRMRQWRLFGTGAFIVGILAGVNMIISGRRGLYMGLILVWAGPFILLLWYVPDDIKYRSTLTEFRPGVLHINSLWDYPSLIL